MLTIKKLISIYITKYFDQIKKSNKIKQTIKFSKTNYYYLVLVQKKKVFFQYY